MPPRCTYLCSESGRKILRHTRVKFYAGLGLDMRDVERARSDPATDYILVDSNLKKLQAKDPGGRYALELFEVMGGKFRPLEITTLLPGRDVGGVQFFLLSIVSGQ